MSQELFRLYIEPVSPRPDFRLVIAFLWHDAQSVDTDGDAFNPASHDWTYLFICNRENEAEMVIVDKVGFNAAPNAPLVLEIKAARDYLATRTAYFLAVSTNSDVSEEMGGEAYNRDDLIGRLGEGFDVQAALRRVELSPFTRSTLENPYPNLP